MFIHQPSSQNSSAAQSEAILLNKVCHLEAHRNTRSGIWHEAWPFYVLCDYVDERLGGITAGWKAPLPHSLVWRCTNTPLSAFLFFTPHHLSPLFFMHSSFNAVYQTQPPYSTNSPFNLPAPSSPFI